MEKRNVKIHKAYIVSCVNSRVEDLARAANVLKGQKVAEGVDLYIAAASSEGRSNPCSACRHWFLLIQPIIVVQEESATRGDWNTLLEAGAKPLPAGCGPCIGLGKGLLADGEVGISATNRNFKGRMGSRDAIAYLASPEVVAASAIKGQIALPEFMKTTPSGSNTVFQSLAHRKTNLFVAGEAPAQATHSIKANAKPATTTESSAANTLLEGFPETITGEIVFVHQDNLNTDGIYAGKWTYNEVAPEKQAEVAMENYDPKFNEIARKGSYPCSPQPRFALN
jgi:homoaconitate hydratase